MTDKDFVFRDQLERHFPGTDLMLCLFHAVRALYRKLFTLMTRMDSEQKEFYLKTLKKVIYSKDNNEYYTNLRRLPEDYYKYYKKNWGEIKKQFIPLFRPKRFNLEKKKNNVCEGYFSKLKKNINKNNETNHFIFKCLEYIQRIRKQTGGKMIKKYLKFTNNIYCTDCPFIKRFGKTLLKFTDYAIKEVIENLKKIDDETMLCSENICSYCDYSIHYGLPCRHQLKFLQSINDHEKLEKYVKKRWMKSLFAELSSGCSKDDICSVVEYISMISDSYRQQSNENKIGENTLEHDDKCMEFEPNNIISFENDVNLEIQGFIEGIEDYSPIFQDVQNGDENTVDNETTWENNNITDYIEDITNSYITDTAEMEVNKNYRVLRRKLNFLLDDIEPMVNKSLVGKIEAFIGDIEKLFKLDSV